MKAIEGMSAHYYLVMTAGRVNPEKEVTRAPKFLILIGALAQIHINFVGEIFLSEIVLYTIWILRKKELATAKRLSIGNFQIGTFEKILMLALASQLFTDIICGASNLDIAKGSCLILFTLFNLKILWSLGMRYPGAENRIILGYAFSFFIGSLIQPNDFFKSYPWKFGFAYGTTLLIFILLQNFFTGRKYSIFFLLLAYMGINFALDTRSLGLIIFIAGVIYLLGSYFWKSKFKAVVILLSILLFVPILYNLYVSEAQNGALGVAIQQKYITQTRNTNNLLYGGRTDFFIALSQVRKSPILGQGSYAKISATNRSEIVADLVATNPNIYPLLYTYREGNMIPIHSILLQFWVWYGLLGSLPWIWYLYTMVRVLKRDLQSAEGVSLVKSYLIALTMWDIFFSPFGSDRRFALPLFMIVMLRSRNFRNGEIHL
jgi:hypothetical protein